MLFPSLDIICFTFCVNLWPIYWLPCNIILYFKNSSSKYHFHFWNQHFDAISESLPDLLISAESHTYTFFVTISLCRGNKSHEWWRWWCWILATLCSLSDPFTLWEPPQNTHHYRKLSQPTFIWTDWLDDCKGEFPFNVPQFKIFPSLTFSFRDPKSIISVLSFICLSLFLV
jgi:hypothetical protein